MFGGGVNQSSSGTSCEASLQSTFKRLTAVLSLSLGVCAPHMIAEHFTWFSRHSSAAAVQSSPFQLAFHSASRFCFVATEGAEMIARYF